MIDLTFTVGGLDLSSKLSTYDVEIEFNYPVSVTTMDGTEHYYEQKRPLIRFTLIPLSDAEVAQVYAKLKDSPITVTFTNSYTGTDTTAQMRVNSNLQNVFGIKSINGNRYYKGGEIELRSLTVM